MAEPADTQTHWTRAGVLARSDAVLTELGHDPQNLSLSRKRPARILWAAKRLNFRIIQARSVWLTT